MVWFFNWIGWSVFGLLLLMLELIMPGVFIMWWGFAALLLGLIVAFLPEMAQSVQITIFAISAVVFSLIGWKYQHTKGKQNDQATTLNAREKTMLGTKGVIVDIQENGIARGKFGDTTWRVMGENLKIGDDVIVQRVEGITLFVKK